ncbi:NAD(P)H-hydrate epimerase, partial [Burkholderia pseudomultivorans]|uniref:NAD(P)H-hydrate epimerase n=1 Tax=Burkholderia pseudomultivorans TaxID=1207504 RepID=UPI002875A0FE
MTAAPLSSDSDPIALLRVAELRAAERDAAATLPPHTLMSRAGDAAARWLSERIARDTRPVWVAVGPGNNGGDALVAAARLQQLGVATQAWMPVPVKPDDAQWAPGIARATGVPRAA